MTELGKAYVQIIPSAQGIGGSISKILDPEAKSAGQSAGSSIGSNLVSTITKVIAVAGIGKLIKDGISASLSAGADIQQSFGGLDTLYAGAQKEIKQYAADAYKAGISANTYAENATAFGATLKQALGGDAVAAANAANMAIMDMADNSAKMGTDIETVQQTYQSLARGNYAMLDNLKLGYGGTKAEMQRLLDKASELTGKNFDMSNFADITEAIHVVQQDLGIAGVAVDEASTTFSGSLQAMKSSFTNVLAALSSGELDITPQLKGLAETTANFIFGNFIPMLGRLFSQLPSAIGALIKAAVPEIKSNLKALFPEMDMSIFSGFMKSLGNIGLLIKFAFMDMKQAISDFFSGFNKTGALISLVSAFQEVTKAGLDLSEKLSGAIPWETIGSATGQVVEFIAEIISTIAQFSQKVDGNIFRGLLIGIPAAIAGFKAFNFLKSFNPFSFFKKNAADGVGGAGEAVKRSKSTISQVFTGLSNVIKSSGTAIKTAAIGIGTGIKTALSGVGPVLRAFGAMLRTAGVANILAFGGAIGIAAVGIGAGIGIIVGSFALLATQSAGISQIITTISTSLGSLASTIIGALAQAFVTIAPYLPIVAMAFAQLSPLITAAGTAIASIITAFASLSPVVVAFGMAFSMVVTAIGGAVSQIIVAATPLVAVLGSVFTTTVQIVSTAIVQIVQALAPVIPAITEMVVAIAPVLQSMVETFTTLITNLSPIIDSLTNLVTGLGDSIRNVLDGAKGVIESFGNAVSSILDSVAGVFDSIGNAALNAGKGFDMLSRGIERLTGLNLFDMGASLAAAATGLAAISATGPGLAIAGMGMQMMATSAQMASVAIQMLPTALTTLSASLGTLPAMMTMAGTAMMTFATSAQSSVMSLMVIGATITKFASTLMTIGPSATVASAGLATFNGQANAAGSAMQRLGSASATALAQVTALGAGIMSSMAGATAAISNAGMQMSTAVRMAGTQMTVAMQASMNQIKMVVLNGMTASTSAVRNGGNQMTTAIRSAGTQMVTITQSTMNQMKSAALNGMTAIVSAIRNGGSQMVSSWQSAGQQLVSSTQNTVNNMNSSLRNVGSGVNLHSNGTALMDGLKSGIDAGWSTITASVSSMAEWIKKNKGPISYDKRLLIPNGLAIMYGLDKGITSGFEEVKSNVLSMANQLAEAISTSISDPFEMVGADAELTKRVSFGQLPKTVQPSVESFDSQKTLIEKVDALIEEVRRSGNTYLDGKIISRKVDRDLGQNTMIRSRTSWA